MNGPGCEVCYDSFVTSFNGSEPFASPVSSFLNSSDEFSGERCQGCFLMLQSEGRFRFLI